MKEAEVIGAGPVSANPAHRGFPRVHVRVDEAGQQDGATCIDRAVGARLDVRRHFRDAVVDDQQLAAGHVANLGVHRNDTGIFKQHAGHIGSSFREAWFSIRPWP
jgi:hypothetical protein